MIVEKLEVFPTRVFIIKNFLDPDEEKKFDEIINGINTDNKPAGSGILLRDNKEDFITDQLEFFYAKSKIEVKKHFNVDVDIFESRFNRMVTGASLPFHHHLNIVNWEQSSLRTFCILTGCYYSNTGSGFAKLRFNNPQLLSRFIGEEPALNLETEPNTLVLFPSWACHGTTLHGSDITRKCLVMEMTLK